MNVAIIGNESGSLVRFRIDLITKLIDDGHTVYTFSNSYSDKDLNKLININAIPLTYPITRNGFNLFLEFSTIKQLKDMFMYYNIELTIAYFLKPILYTGIAAKLLGIDNSYSIIAGLGYAFTKNYDKKFDLKRLLYKYIIIFNLKIVLRWNKIVFFQNKDDYNYFVKNFIIQTNKSKVIDGSGVNLKQYKYTPPSINPIRFISSGRLIKAKGFEEYLNAAKKIKDIYPRVSFVILGDIDDNPSSLQRSFLSEAVKLGIIEWPGNVDNVNEWLSNSSVFVLCSYYREGIPRSILEALAVGRPIITTNLPGCKETVIEHYNGIFIKERDVESIFLGMEFFIKNPSKIQLYGTNSRRLAETRFDVNIINKIILDNLDLKP